LSNDYDVATKLKPEQSVVDEFVCSRKELSVEGKLGVGDGNVIINRLMSSGFQALAEIYGPFVAEDDDIAEALVATIPAPRWLLQIVVPAGSQDDVDIALSLAQHVARRCDGAVFDRQSDGVVWHKKEQGVLKKFFSKPKGQGIATVNIGAEKTRIREVRLEWFLPISSADSRTAKLFLDSMRRVCLEAVPTRFGTFEPFQGRLEQGDDSPFIEAWKKAGQAKVLGDVSFRSKRPCFGGGVYISGPEAMRGDDGIRQVHLLTSFDGRPLETDERWRERIVSVFIEISKSLNAFYAHAYVLRNVVLHGNTVGYDGDTEIYPLPMGMRWKGIPPTPTWLTWFGRPYAELVEDEFRNMDVQKMPEGLFVRLGKEPLDLDKLRQFSPRLPDKVLAKMGEDRRAGPADFIPVAE